MKKLAQLLVLAVLMVTTMGQDYIIQFRPSAAAEDYTDINVFLTYENCGSPPCGNYTLGDTDCAVSFSTIVKNGAMEINGNRPAVGTYGAEAPTAQDFYSMAGGVQDAQFNSSSGRVGFWLEVDETPTATQRIFIADDTTGGDDSLRIYIRTDMDLEAEWEYGGVAQANCIATASNLSLDTAYFVQVKYDAGQTAGSDLLSIFWDTNSVDCTGLTLTPIDTAIEAIKHGKVIGADDLDLHFDNLIISDDLDRDLYLIRNETDEGNLSNSCGA